MLSSFLSYWNYGRKYCGIEFNSTPEGQRKISVLTAIRKNEEFEVESSFHTDNLEECPQQLKKNQHAFLCITGNQVLIKCTQTTGAVAKIISSAFPNVDLNEFYFETLQTPTGSIVALCRKEQVHKVFSFFEKNNIRIIGFSLGFFSIRNLLGEIEKEEISFSGYSITTHKNKIVSFKRSPKAQEEVNYSIGDTRVISTFLLPLCAIFNYPKGNIHTLTNFTDTNQELKKEHHQKIFFRKGLSTAVTLLLVLLLFNFILYSGYYSEFQALTAKHQAELFQKQANDEKRLQIAEKENIVRNIFNNSNSRSSFYLNQLTANKPSSVLLSELTYQPLQKQVKEKDPVSLEKDILRIAGEIKNKNDFSQWIKELEETKWIKEVQVSDFSYNSAGSSQFIMNINLKEDETIE